MDSLHFLFLTDCPALMLVALLLFALLMENQGCSCEWLYQRLGLSISSPGANFPRGEHTQSARVVGSTWHAWAERKNLIGFGPSWKPVRFLKLSQRPGNNTCEVSKKKKKSILSIFSFLELTAARGQRVGIRQNNTLSLGGWTVQIT